MGRLWQANLRTLLDRSRPAAERLAALHRIDRLFGGPPTPADQLEAVTQEIEANLQ
jgi:hypothetical protein